MSGSSATYILPGRHQPPHFDHLRLISAALEHVPTELYIGLIVSPPPRGEPDTHLEREARLHHTLDRAPFSFDLRRRLLEAAFAEHLDLAARSRLRIIALPRPELDFELVEAIFPGPRVWIIPELGEAFDEMKARFFAERGDRVMRIAGSSEVSGQTVRALIEAEAWTPLETHAPRSVIQLIREDRARRKKS